MTIILCNSQKQIDLICKELDPTQVKQYIYNDDFDTNLIEHRRVILWGNFPKHIQNLKFEILKFFCVPTEFDVFEKEWQKGEFQVFMRGKLSDTFIDYKPKTETQSASNNAHFRMLGYDKDENSNLVYHFFSYEAKTIIKLRPSSMTKSNLMMLAPLNFWEASFGAGSTRSSKFDVDAAQQFLMQYSHNVGIFKEKYIRGRGAWIDDKRLIIHTGDSLIVNLKPTPLKNFPSKYVYEINESLGFNYSNPLDNSDAAKIIDSCKWLLWERQINAYLLAGWCVIAPFCGVLDWRPHIWITGPSGSGKSWVGENILKTLLGDTCITVQGKTTEAGVRGLLQSDALPVVFDESDVDNQNDKERVQSNLALARSSSSKNGGQISKGTQTGLSRTYTIRSMFAFLSIGVQLNQQSDKSRFTVLGLMPFDKTKSQDSFEKFTTEWHKLATPDFVQSLQSRTMELMPVILKNSKVFADAVFTVIGNKRIGDQVGSMLAGAYSLSSKKEISFENALKWVKEKDWTDEKALEMTKDEYRLFGKLMSSLIRVDGEFRSIERSVGELILVANGRRFEPQIDPTIANDTLLRIGMRIKNNRLFISNTADGIIKILKDSPWSSNYNKVLERLPDSKKEESTNFGPLIRTRAVSISLDMIQEDLITTVDNPNYLNENYKTETQTEMPF